MKTNKYQKNKKIYIILGIALFIICGSVFGIVLWRRSQQPESQITDSSEKIDYGPPTDEQKQSGEDIKTSVSQSAASADFGVIISAANVNGDIIQIRGMISGLVSNDGTCDLTLSQAGVSVQKTAPTYALPVSSTCQGFDINRSELSTGTWDINLTVTVNGQAASAVGQVTLE